MPEYVQRLEQAFQAHGTRLWRTACALLNNEADAEDAIQQALLVLCAKGEHLPDPLTYPWLATVVANMCRNQMRFRKRRRARYALEAELASNTRADSVSLGAAMETRIPSPDADSSDRELAKMARQELADLPEHEREALVLTCLSGFTHSEAAAIRGIPLPTQKSHAQRGLQRLRERLGVGEAAAMGLVGDMTFSEPGGGLASTISTWLAGANDVSATLGSWSVQAAASAGASGLSQLAGATVMSTIQKITTACIIGVIGFGAGAFALGDGAKQQSPSLSRDLNPSTEQPGDAGRQTQLRGDAGRYAHENQVLQHDMELLRSEMVALQQDRMRLLAELDVARAGKSVEASAAPQPLVPRFTHTADVPWFTSPEFAEFATDYQDIHTTWLAIESRRKRGEEPSPQLNSALHQAYESAQAKHGAQILMLMGKLPTHSRDRLPATLSHPAFIVGTWQEWLAAANLPLTDTQLQNISLLAQTFDRNWQARQDSYSPETLAIEKVADEWRLKQSFHDDALKVMSSEQRNLLVPVDVQGQVKQSRFAPLDVLNEATYLGFQNTNFAELLGTSLKSTLNVDDAFLAVHSVTIRRWSMESEGSMVRGSGLWSPAFSARSVQQIESLIQAQIKAFKAFLENCTDQEQKRRIREYPRLFSPGMMQSG